MFSLKHKKIISVFLLMTFLFTEMGQANPAAIPVPERFTQAREWDRAMVDIPQELGTVLHESKGKGPFVIHIQDAHGHYEAQMRIKQLLETLTQKQGVSLIAVEGSVGPLESKLFRFFPFSTVNSKIADFLVREGELTGAEYFAIENENPEVELYGVEDENLYREDLQAYREVYQQLETHKDMLDKIKNDLNFLKARWYGQELRRFSEKQEQFQAQESSLTEYLQGLGKAAARYAGVDLTDAKQQVDYPNLTRLTALKKMEAAVAGRQSAIEAEKNALRAKLIEVLPAEAEETRFLLGTLENLKSGAWPVQLPPRFYFEALWTACQKHGIALESFAAFKDYAAFVILQNELDARELYAEIETLEERILAALVQSEEERMIAKLDKNMRQLRKFLSLEFSKEQWGDFKLHAKEMAPSAMAQEITALKEGRSGHGKNGIAAIDFSRLDEAVRSAEHFYDLAIKRETALLDNLLNLAQVRGDKKVVLITGGFHSHGIGQILEERGIARVSIAPRMTQVEEHSPYHNVIMNGKTFLDRELEKSGNAKSLSGTPDKIVAFFESTRPDIYGRVNEDTTRPYRSAAGGVIKVGLRALAQALIDEDPALAGDQPALSAAINQILSALPLAPSAVNGTRWTVAYSEDGSGRMFVVPSPQNSSGLPPLSVQLTRNFSFLAVEETLEAAALGQSGKDSLVADVLLHFEAEVFSLAIANIQKVLSEELNKEADDYDADVVKWGAAFLALAAIFQGNIQSAGDFLTQISSHERITGDAQAQFALAKIVEKISLIENLYKEPVIAVKSVLDRRRREIKDQLVDQMLELIEATPVADRLMPLIQQIAGELVGQQPFVNLDIFPNIGGSVKGDWQADELNRGITRLGRFADPGRQTHIDEMIQRGGALDIGILLTELDTEMVLVPQTNSLKVEGLIEVINGIMDKFGAASTREALGLRLQEIPLMDRIRSAEPFGAQIRAQYQGELAAEIEYSISNIFRVEQLAFHLMIAGIHAGNLISLEASALGAAINTAATAVSTPKDFLRLLKIENGEQLKSRKDEAVEIWVQNIWFPGATSVEEFFDRPRIIRGKIGKIHAILKSERNLAEVRLDIQPVVFTGGLPGQAAVREETAPEDLSADNFSYLNWRVLTGGSVVLALLAGITAYTLSRPAPPREAVPAGPAPTEIVKPAEPAVKPAVNIPVSIATQSALSELRPQYSENRVTLERGQGFVSWNISDQRIDLTPQKGYRYVTVWLEAGGEFDLYLEIKNKSGKSLAGQVTDGSRAISLNVNETDRSRGYKTVDLSRMLTDEENDDWAAQEITVSNVVGGLGRKITLGLQFHDTAEPARDGEAPSASVTVPQAADDGLPAENPVLTNPLLGGVYDDTAQGFFRMHLPSGFMAHQIDTLNTPQEGMNRAGDFGRDLLARTLILLNHNRGHKYAGLDAREVSNSILRDLKLLDQMIRNYGYHGMLPEELLFRNGKYTLNPQSVPVQPKRAGIAYNAEEWTATLARLAIIADIYGPGMASDLNSTEISELAEKIIRDTDMSFLVRDNRLHTRGFVVENTGEIVFGADVLTTPHGWARFLPPLISRGILGSPADPANVRVARGRAVWTGLRMEYAQQAAGGISYAVGKGSNDKANALSATDEFTGAAFYDPLRFAPDSWGRSTANYVQLAGEGARSSGHYAFGSGAGMQADGSAGSSGLNNNTVLHPHAAFSMLPLNTVLVIDNIANMARGARRGGGYQPGWGLLAALKPTDFTPVAKGISGPQQTDILEAMSFPLLRAAASNAETGAYFRTMDQANPAPALKKAVPAGAKTPFSLIGGNVLTSVQPFSQKAKAAGNSAFVSQGRISISYSLTDDNAFSGVRVLGSVDTAGYGYARVTLDPQQGLPQRIKLELKDGDGRKLYEGYPISPIRSGEAVVFDLKKMQPGEVAEVIIVFEKDEVGPRKSGSIVVQDIELTTEPGASLGIDRWADAGEKQRLIDAFKPAGFFTGVEDIEVAADLSAPGTDVTQLRQGPVEASANLFWPHALAGVYGTPAWLGNNGNAFLKDRADAALLEGVDATFRQIADWYLRVLSNEGDRDFSVSFPLGMYAPAEQNAANVDALQVDWWGDVLEGTEGVKLDTILGAISMGNFVERNGAISVPDLAYFYRWIVGPQAKDADLKITNNMIDDVEKNIREIMRVTGKTIDQIKVIVTLRERHIAILQKLKDMGVQFDAEDINESGKIKFEHMDERSRPEGLYRSGNVLLIQDGDMMPVFSVMNGEYDVSLAATGSNESLAAGFVAKLFGGKLRGRLLPSSKKEIKEFIDAAGALAAPVFIKKVRDAYLKHNLIPPDLTDAEAKALEDRLRNNLALNVHLSDEQRQWDYVWTESTAIPAADGVFYAGNVKPVGHPVPGVPALEGFTFDPAAGLVKANVLRAALNGDVRVFQVTFKTDLQRFQQIIDEKTAERGRTRVKLKREQLSLEISEAHYQRARIYAHFQYYALAESEINMSFKETVDEGQENKISAAFFHMQGMLALVNKPEQTANQEAAELFDQSFTAGRHDDTLGPVGTAAIASMLFDEQAATVEARIRVAIADQRTPALDDLNEAERLRLRRRDFLSVIPGAGQEDNNARLHDISEWNKTYHAASLGSQEQLLQQLENNSDWLTWKTINDELLLLDAGNTVDFTIQLARGVKVSLPVHKRAFAAYSALALRYVTATAYELAIKYGTDFIALGNDSQILSDDQLAARVSEIIDAEYLNVSNFRADISQYANQGGQVRVLPAAQAVRQESYAPVFTVPVSTRNYQENYPGLYLGIDIGGTGMKFSLLENGREVELPQDLRSIPTLPGNGGADFTRRLAEHAAKIRAAVGQINAFAISIAGAIDKENDTNVSWGQISESETHQWTDTDKIEANKKRDAVAQALNISQDRGIVRNDMDGIGQGIISQAGVQNAYLAALGTGLGTQIIVNGSLLDGPTELGHAVSDFGVTDGFVYDTEATTRIPNIMAIAKSKGFDFNQSSLSVLAQQAGRKYVLGREEVLPIGLAAASADDAQKQIARDTLQAIAPNLAKHFIQVYELNRMSGIEGVNEVVLAGNVTSGKTGAIIAGFVNEELQRLGYQDKIKLRLIAEEQINVENIGAYGAAVLAQRHAQDLAGAALGIDLDAEKENGRKVAALLRGAVLNANGDVDLAKKFTQGGFKQPGYGVQEGAANDGSHARGKEGNQGYYVDGGQEIFLGTVKAMQDHIRAREAKTGKKVRLIIKPGIGGQHTPFQGIASTFAVIDAETGLVMGEYELGKDFSAALRQYAKDLDIGWDQILIVPSSKSGSTDETMMVFKDILKALLRETAARDIYPGEQKQAQSLADLIYEVLHEVNFIDGKERPGAELFSVSADRFDGIDNLIDLISERTGGNVPPEKIRDLLGKVLGNMFFETTDNKAQSRLAAFIRNSGLYDQLGDDKPGFGAMFDNVGGRWTGDLHMMTFLAYYFPDLSMAEQYYERRSAGIDQVREGTHVANEMGNKVLDEGITDIALVIPDEMFWFGKSSEQNFNESIWQPKGFANLVAVRQSDWEAQKVNYQNIPGRMVINLSGKDLTEDGLNIFDLRSRVNMPAQTADLSKEQAALLFADLFTTFYGMTNTVGTRLIARALQDAGYSPDDVDMSDLDNPATQIVQRELFLRQPFVELGKGFLENMLKELQKTPTAIRDKVLEVIDEAEKRTVQSNVPGLPEETNLKSVRQMARNIQKQVEYARETGRKFVPFIYLEGEKFYQLRDELIKLGLEWVMQGTGDQHISYQQVLTHPEKFLPLIISYVPTNAKKWAPANPAVGLAKGYLDNVSPHLVRHLFAVASYQALQQQGGKGSLWVLADKAADRDAIYTAHKTAKSNIPPLGILPAETFVSIDVRAAALGTEPIRLSDGNYLVAYLDQAQAGFIAGIYADSGRRQPVITAGIYLPTENLDEAETIVDELIGPSLQRRLQREDNNYEQNLARIARSGAFRHGLLYVKNAFTLRPGTIPAIQRTELNDGNILRTTRFVDGFLAVVVDADGNLVSEYGLYLPIKPGRGRDAHNAVVAAINNTPVRNYAAVLDAIAAQPGLQTYKPSVVYAASLGAGKAAELPAEWKVNETFITALLEAPSSPLTVAEKDILLRRTGLRNTPVESLKAVGVSQIQPVTAEHVRQMFRDIINAASGYYHSQIWESEEFKDSPSIYHPDYENIPATNKTALSRLGILTIGQIGKISRKNFLRIDGVAENPARQFAAAGVTFAADGQGEQAFLKKRVPGGLVDVTRFSSDPYYAFEIVITDTMGKDLFPDAHVWVKGSRLLVWIERDIMEMLNDQTPQGLIASEYKKQLQEKFSRDISDARVRIGALQPEVFTRFSVRVRKALARAGIRSRAELSQKTEADLLAIRGFGELALKELKAAGVKLSGSSLGASLGMDEIEDDPLLDGNMLVTVGTNATTVEVRIYNPQKTAVAVNERLVMTTTDLLEASAVHEWVLEQMTDIVDEDAVDIDWADVMRQIYDRQNEQPTPLTLRDDVPTETLVLSVALAAEEEAGEELEEGAEPSAEVQRQELADGNFLVLVAADFGFNMIVVDSTNTPLIDQVIFVSNDDRDMAVEIFAVFASQLDSAVSTKRGTKSFNYRTGLPQALSRTGLDGSDGVMMMDAASLGEAAVLAVELPKQGRGSFTSALVVNGWANNIVSSSDPLRRNWLRYYGFVGGDDGDDLLDQARVVNQAVLAIAPAETVSAQAFQPVASSVRVNQYGVVATVVDEDTPVSIPVLKRRFAANPFSRAVIVYRGNKAAFERFEQEVKAELGKQADVFYAADNDAAVESLNYLLSDSFRAEMSLFLKMPGLTATELQSRITFLVPERFSGGIKTPLSTILILPGKDEIGSLDLSEVTAFQTATGYVMADNAGEFARLNRQLPDAARALKQSGARSNVFVINSDNPQAITDAVSNFADQMEGYMAALQSA